uniref:Uncharacterized protein n=2 Tax=Cyprinus carpio TaxID=7962 RepID=A0A9J7ZVF7_CYPCA
MEKLSLIFKDGSGKEKMTLRQELGLTSAVSLVYACVLLCHPFGIIAGSLSFAKYALCYVPYYKDGLVIATASLQNINFTIAAQAVFMVERFVCLMIIVIGGIITLLQGNYESLLNLESAFADTKLGISTVGMALYQCLWSYAGWYNLNNVTEEVKRPEVRLSLLQCHYYVQC